jgi:hypothetical protein
LIVIYCESSPHLNSTLLFPCHILQHSLASVYNKGLGKYHSVLSCYDTFFKANSIIIWSRGVCVCLCVCVETGILSLKNITNGISASKRGNTCTYSVVEQWKHMSYILHYNEFICRHLQPVVVGIGKPCSNLLSRNLQEMCQRLQ